MIAGVASASGSASASSSTSVARSTAVSTKETTTTESKVVQMMTLVALIVFMAFKMSLMTLLTMMTMMALKILFNVADLPRAGFEGTVRVHRIREEIGQYSFFFSWPLVSIQGPSCSQNHPCIHKNERCPIAKVSENEEDICLQKSQALRRAEMHAASSGKDPRHTVLPR